MNIKYHEYGKGCDYDTNHILTDNWNPDLNYGNEYVKVTFNINTPTFDYVNVSFNSRSDNKNWHNEARTVISSLGIAESKGYKTTNAYLILFPSQISGIVLKNDVKRIAEAINGMRLSSIRWVDIRKTVYDISDDEYKEYLNSKRNEIRKEVFVKAATPRTTKYYLAFDVASKVCKKINILRLQNGGGYNDGKAITYIMEVIKEMINEGFLRSVQEDDDRLYIRALNKTEQKKLKL